MGSPCWHEPTGPTKQGHVINICYVQLSVMHADMQPIGVWAATAIRALFAQKMRLCLLTGQLALLQTCNGANASEKELKLSK